MIIADYLRAKKDISWDYAKQAGAEHAVIRLPEEDDFDLTRLSHWQPVIERFYSAGLTPVAVEPMPDSVHSHIKLGDKKRDESIEKVIKMLSVMDQLHIRTICFNFMAHIGWLRTTGTYPERGGALVTAFNMEDFQPADDFVITEKELWENYEYFLRAVIPYAERYGIRLGLHPDDPPVERLGGVSRIMTSFEKIHRAVHLVESPCLGVTLCQACYSEMGEELERVIPAFAGERKIFFIHFRDVVGNRYRFHESFHDNGQTDMARTIRLYLEYGVDVPIRVDHVPTMAGESPDIPGYAAVGRLFALGYLKGLLEMAEHDKEKKER